MTLARQAKRTRLVLVITALLAVASGVALVTTALNDNIMFFRSPSDLATEPVNPGVRFRLGGLVQEGSVEREGDFTRFSITDGGAETTVTYSGLLPDLFREGQGVVTEGALSDFGVFEATTVLARHDENYMPTEVAEALKEQGLFQHSDGSAKGSDYQGSDYQGSNYQGYEGYEGYKTDSYGSSDGGS